MIGAIKQMVDDFRQIKAEQQESRKVLPWSVFEFSTADKLNKVAESTILESGLRIDLANSMQGLPQLRPLASSLFSQTWDISTQFVPAMYWAVVDDPDRPEICRKAYKVSPSSAPAKMSKNLNLPLLCLVLLSALSHQVAAYGEAVRVTDPNINGLSISANGEFIDFISQRSQKNPVLKAVPSKYRQLHLFRDRLSAAGGKAFIVPVELPFSPAKCMNEDLETSDLMNVMKELYTNPTATTAVMNTDECTGFHLLVSKAPFKDNFQKPLRTPGDRLAAYCAITPSAAASTRLLAGADDLFLSVDTSDMGIKDPITHYLNRMRTRARDPRTGMTCAAHGAPAGYLNRRGRSQREYSGRALSGILGPETCSLMCETYGRPGRDPGYRGQVCYWNAYEVLTHTCVLGYTNRTEEIKNLPDNDSGYDQRSFYITTLPRGCKMSGVDYRVPHFNISGERVSAMDYCAYVTPSELARRDGQLMEVQTLDPQILSAAQQELDAFMREMATYYSIQPRPEQSGAEHRLKTVIDNLQTETLEPQTGWSNLTSIEQDLLLPSGDVVAQIKSALEATGSITRYVGQATNRSETIVRQLDELCDRYRLLDGPRPFGRIMADVALVKRLFRDLVNTTDLMAAPTSDTLYTPVVAIDSSKLTIIRRYITGAEPGSRPAQVIHTKIPYTAETFKAANFRTAVSLMSNSDPASAMDCIRQNTSSASCRILQLDEARHVIKMSHFVNTYEYVIFVFNSPDREVFYTCRDNGAERLTFAGYTVMILPATCRLLSAGSWLDDGTSSAWDTAHILLAINETFPPDFRLSKEERVDAWLDKVDQELAYQRRTLSSQRKSANSQLSAIEARARRDQYVSRESRNRIKVEMYVLFSVTAAILFATLVVIVYALCARSRAG